MNEGGKSVMAETKKTVKEVENKVVETAKKVADKVQVKEAAKKVAEKVQVKEAAKKVAEKVPVKETAKKVAAKKPAAKKTAAKAPKTEVILQYSGKEVAYADLVKKAVQLSKKALKKPAKDVKVYVKPEENMAYYVANGGEDIGSFQI